MKTWNVTSDGAGYYVELKNNKQVVVNGAVLNLKEYRVKTGMLQTEYEIPVGFRKALLIIRSMSQPRLIMDNRDCATGEEYVPFKTPAWAYVFIVLHCGNFLNGALGGALAAVGMLTAASVSSNQKLNLALRIIINIVILIAAYAIMFGIAFALTGLWY